MAPSPQPRPSIAAERVLSACRSMLDAGGPVPLATLAAICHSSPRQLSRSFADVLGVTPHDFGQAVRTGRARELLRSSPSVSEALVAAGFGSVRAFYEAVPQTIGMDPATYRSGASGQTLRWTTILTSIGTIIVVASDRGLAAVRIGSSTSQLVDEVADEFPGAELVEDVAGLGLVATAVGRLSQGLDATVDLPLDLTGTAFQARVWEALRRIPAGEVRSYAEVAAAIGSPSAVRAVGSACGRNPVALVIPCHRVVRSDGGLGGYRWGLEVKRALLETEARA